MSLGQGEIIIAHISRDALPIFHVALNRRDGREWRRGISPSVYCDEERRVYCESRRLFVLCRAAWLVRVEQ